MSACVFLGPTLSPADAAAVLPARYLPPASQGDVYRAVLELRPRAIGIVDGYFQWVPSVWHKEILWAMREGVHLFGAASMGALRAAELADFGMRGVGRIFEAYRRGTLGDSGGEPFEDDDEVAVVHGPAESGYIAVSEAMVNIRCTLASAQAAGVIGARAGVRLTAIAKALHFPERGYGLLLERARAEGLPAAELAALEAWLPAGRGNQKRADALALLESLRDFLAADPEPARPAFAFEHTTLWERALAAMAPAAGRDDEDVHVLDEIRLLGAGSAERHGSEEITRLRERAEDKHARLATRRDLPEVEAFSGLQLLELRDWYFTRVLGREMPDDIAQCVKAWGYSGLAHFHRAIFGEFVYRQMLGGADAAAGPARTQG
jgi:hypothetical protein